MIKIDTNNHINDKIKELYVKIDKQIKKGVYVGIPSTKTKRKKGEPISNSEIAYINEFGSPVNNIPARPFLYPTLQREHAQIVKILKPLEIFNLYQNLEKAGLYASSQVKKTITEQIGFTPLSPKTIRARELKRVSGLAGDKALLDTGQLRQSITYIVR